MKPILIYLLLIFSSLLGYPQSKGDSLKKLLVTSSPKEKSIILNQLSDDQLFNSPRQSLKFASDALIEAKKCNDLEQVARAYLNIGTALRYLGENQAALDSLYKTISFINNLKDSKLVAKILNVIGVVHYQLGHDSMSMDAYNKSLKIRNEINDLEGVADILNNVGNLYNGLGNFDKALDYYFKCLKYDQMLNNKKGLSATYNNIGMVHFNLKEYSKSIIYYQKAESLAVSQNEVTKIASIYNNIGATYLALRKYDEAIKYTKQSNAYYQKTNQILQTQRNYTNLGLIFEYKGNLDSSIYNQTIALSLANKLSNPSLIAGAHINLSHLYQKKHNLNLALAELDMAKKSIATSDKLDVMSKLYLAYANVYSSMEKYHDAFDYLAQHISLRDSLYNLEKVQKVAQIEAQYETEKQAQRIQTLQMNQKFQNLKIQKTRATVRRLIAIVAIITILVSLIVWLYINNYRNSLKLAQKNDQINQQNTMLNEVNCELQQINHQLAESQEKLRIANHTKEQLFGIVAHDMKSPLDHLRTLVFLLRNPKESSEFYNLDANLLKLDTSLKSVNELLNNLLNWAQVQQDQIYYQESSFNLADIFEENLKLFEHLITEKRLCIIKKYNQTLVVNSDRNMIDFILRNLISNAIKFSLEKGNIYLSGILVVDGFSIAVTDEGTGMEASLVEKLFTQNQIRRRGTHNEKGAGLALQICQKFAEQLGGKMEIVTAEGKGSTFTLKVERQIYSINN